ncbi:Transcription factor [Dirofilaria immitis]
MSVDESRSSTPLVSTSESSSPAASSSLPDNQGACFNGYQSGIGENTRVESPSQGISLPNNIYMHRIQSASPADDHQFIRRPLNAYMIFTKQERKKLLALNPNMKMHEASRIMGEKWKNMSEKEKRQYFEASKQNRLDHKKALKDNPNLVYHPQRKKLSKILMKTEQSNITFDTAPSTPLSNGGATSVTFATPSTPKINGCVNGNVVYAQVPAQTLTTAPPGTVILAQAVNVRTPQHQSQRNHQGAQSVQQNNSQPNLSATMHQMLELYYTSLCEPAFPEPGEKSTLASPQHYLDQYHMLHHQAVTKQQQHGSQSLPHIFLRAMHSFSKKVQKEAMITGCNLDQQDWFYFFAEFSNWLQKKVFVSKFHFLEHLSVELWAKL